MKTYAILATVALIATAFSFTASGQAPAPTAGEIVYVSAQRVMNESVHGRSEATRIRTLQQTKATELRTKQQTLEATRQQLVQTADAATRGQLLQQESQQRSDLERSTAEAQRDLQNLQREVNADLQQRVRAVLDEVAKTRDIRIVLNSETSMMWGAPDADLTGLVIERLNGRQ